MDTPKHVGLIGKVGPAFKNGRAHNGAIEVADIYNDEVWTVSIPGDYFGSDRPDCVRAAFDFLIAND